ncbi:MAG: DUF2141 domain-containing protein [Pseudomonadota bacterium]
MSQRVCRIEIFAALSLVSCIVGGAAFAQPDDNGAPGYSALDASLPTQDESALPHVSCRGGDYEIQLEIRGVKESIGLMTAELFSDNEEGFLNKGGRLQRVRFAAKAPITRLCLQPPSSGKYAIAVYHDENANKVLDRRTLGIPSEPFGISNNPIMRFAPPTLDEAAFNVGADGARITIKLRN